MHHGLELEQGHSPPHCLTPGPMALSDPGTQIPDPRHSPTTAFQTSVLQALALSDPSLSTCPSDPAPRLHHNPMLCKLSVIHPFISHGPLDPNPSAPSPTDPSPKAPSPTDRSTTAPSAPRPKAPSDPGPLSTSTPQPLRAPGPSHSSTSAPAVRPLRPQSPHPRPHSLSPRTCSAEVCVLTPSSRSRRRPPGPCGPGLCGDAPAMLLPAGPTAAGRGHKTTPLSG